MSQTRSNPLDDPVDGRESELVVVVSYFDKKIGPTIFLQYPEGQIDMEVEMVLNQIFDQTTSEGFFWHSISKQFETSMNYYFEIKSDWARGFIEMLMVSILFNEKVSADKEHEILSWVTDLVQKLRGKPDVFKAFYHGNRDHVDPDEADAIKENYELVKKWVEELYWSTKEEVRKKTEEEEIASLMVNDALYLTIKKLSKHPVKLNDLKEWFESQDFLRDFDTIIKLLEEHKFIFINKIGHDNYVILVKDLKIGRVPPACVMELIEKRPELHELIEHYIKVVGEFFDSYRFGDDEKKELFEILARPKHYNLIMELRKGPIEKAKIGDILRKGPVVATSINVLGDLQRLDIIDTYTLDGVPWVFLKTDIVIQDSFPEYMQKALPDEDKIAPISGRFDFRLLGPGDEVGILREAFFPPRPESKEPVGRSPASRDIASEDVMDESNQSTFEADTAFDEIVDKISEKYDEKNNQRRNENDEGQIRN